eukprot:411451-Rhodomonas_salina.1
MTSSASPPFTTTSSPLRSRDTFSRTRATILAADPSGLMDSYSATPGDFAEVRSVGGGVRDESLSKEYVDIAEDTTAKLPVSGNVVGERRRGGYRGYQQGTAKLI